MEDNQFPAEISLSLSGGAAKGAYHLGIINILQNRGVTLKAISGTSIGAVIGAALASGKSAEEIFTIMSSKEYRKVFKLYMKEGALFRIDIQAQVLKELIPVKTFEELDIPLIVCVTDIIKARPKYMNRGDLTTAVLASSSISPLLPPIVFNGTVLSDGGLTDNFPVEQLQKFDYPIVGINLYPNNQRIPKTFFGWLRKNIRVAWQNRNFEKESLCDYYFTNVALDEVKAFSFSDMQKAYALGQKDMELFLESKHTI
ncbi:patatin-like phospholipase family protein [Sulfurimonas sp.]